jgi:hypothetical protein
MMSGNNMNERERLDFQILHLETALTVLKARPGMGDPVERATTEIDLLALYERRGGPTPSLQ